MILPVGWVVPIPNPSYTQLPVSEPPAGYTAGVKEVRIGCTTAKWAVQVPDDFRFAVKGSRYLTHVRRLRDLETGLDRFWERLEPLREAGKLGPVLWQLPPNFQRDDQVLAAALKAMPAADHCFEFRHPSWFAAGVYALLERHDASLALGHDARRPLPAAAPVGPLAYLRLHYGERGRRGNYSQAELKRWRRRIAAWRSRRPAFVYLNNDWEGFAPRQCHGVAGGPLPNAPVAEDRRGPPTAGASGALLAPGAGRGLVLVLARRAGRRLDFLVGPRAHPHVGEEEDEERHGDDQGEDGRPSDCDRRQDAQDDQRDHVHGGPLPDPPRPYTGRSPASRRVLRFDVHATGRGHAQLSFGSTSRA